MWNAVDAATAACDRLRAVEDESSAALADALNAQDAAMDALPEPPPPPQKAFATIRVRDIIDERVDAYACHQRREQTGAPDARRWFAASKVGSKTLLLADTLGYVPATPTMQRERAAHPGGYDHAGATGCPASRHGDPCRQRAAAKRVGVAVEPHDNAIRATARAGAALIRTLAAEQVAHARIRAGPVSRRSRERGAARHHGEDRMTTFTCSACSSYDRGGDGTIRCHRCAAHTAPPTDPMPSEGRAWDTTSTHLAVPGRSAVAEHERRCDDDGLAAVAVSTPITPDDTPGGAALRPPMATALVDARSAALLGRRGYQVFAGHAKELRRIVEALQAA